MSESCLNCHYWSNDGKDNHGFCKRYPPQVQLIMVKEKFTNKPTTMQNIYFPITKNDSWCGEWKGKAA